VWRTADAFGFQKIYMVYSKEKPINPKKIGKASSSSANKWLSFKIFDSIEKCYTELKKDGFKIYATVLDKEAKSLQSTIFNLQSSIFNLQSSIFKDGGSVWKRTSGFVRRGDKRG